MSESGARISDARFGEVLSKREHKGSDWCRRKGIGRLRREITEGPPISINSPRFKDRAVLAEFCRDCPLHCELRG